MKQILLFVLVVVLICGAIYALDSMWVREPSISSTYSSNSQLANPASVYCAQQGGTNVIITLGNGSQDGLCQFDDNMACEEWAMMRGECPIGGVKTTGFDNMGQMYCAWLGGQTLAVANSTCALPDGKNCSTDNLWSGTCN